MPRASVKENKNIYQLAREEYGEKTDKGYISRQEAAELLEFISDEKIEKIENQGVAPHPDEVLMMAKKYKKPTLCNYYCSKECVIGSQYVPEIQIKDLSQIVLEMLNSLNGIDKKKQRLIEITVDGKIDDDEIEDLIAIQDQLEKISITVETLQLWVEKMRVSGLIDEEKYNAVKEK